MSKLFSYQSILDVCTRIFGRGGKNSKNSSLQTGKWQMPVNASGPISQAKLVACLDYYGKEITPIVRQTLIDSIHTWEQFYAFKSQLEAEITTSLKGGVAISLNANDYHESRPCDQRIFDLILATAIEMELPVAERLFTVEDLGLAAMLDLPLETLVLDHLTAKQAVRHFTLTPFLDSNWGIRLHEGLEPKCDAHPLGLLYRVAAGPSGSEAYNELWLAVAARLVQAKMSGADCYFGNSDSCRWRIGGKGEEWAMALKEIAVKKDSKERKVSHRRYPTDIL